VFRPEAVIAGRGTGSWLIRSGPSTLPTSGELVDYLSRDTMAEIEHAMSRYLGLSH